MTATATRLFAGSLLLAAALHAQTLYEFESPAILGSSLVDGGDGFHYGTAVRGGSAGKGEIYKINLVTGERATVVSFDGTNGSYPYGDVVFRNQIPVRHDRSGRRERHGHRVQDRPLHRRADYRHLLRRREGSLP